MAVPAPKTLYTSGDRRLNLDEISSLGLNSASESELLSQAEAVACLIPKYRMNKTPGGFEFKSDISSLKQYRPLQQGEKFQDEITPGFGTAFYIGNPRLVLTAAHCFCKSGSDEVDEAVLQSTYIVFGFSNVADGKCKDKFKKGEVFTAKKVIGRAWKAQPSEDWLILKLNEEVTGIAPLKLDFTNPVCKFTELHMFGHPLGLPKKYTYGAIVKEISDDVFQTDLDACGGNSGSPVIREPEGSVVGILIRGNKDYELVPGSLEASAPRMRSFRPTSEEASILGYEKCQPIFAIEFLKMYIGAVQLHDTVNQYRLGLYYAELPNLKKAISWLNKAAAQGHSDAKKKIEELNEDDPREPLEKNPSRFRKLVRGLNFKFICPNNSCLAQKSFVYLPIGLGNFSIAEELDKLSCPGCAKSISNKDVPSLVFWSCEYTIEGRKLSPQMEHVHRTRSVGQKMIKISDLGGSDVKWSYIKVLTK